MLDLYGGPSGNRGLTTTVASRQLEFEASVKALPLDEILTAEERSRLKLIKIDIEGGEGPVVRRFLDTLDLYRPDVALIVEVSPSDEWREIFERMRNAGFAAFVIANSYSRDWYLKHRHQITPPAPIVQPPVELGDVLFIKDLSPG